MLSMITASARKRFSGTRSTDVNKLFMQQWHEHTLFPKTLPHVTLLQALPIIQPHTYLHAVVELVGGSERSWWHTETSTDSPQKGSVGDRVIFLGDLDKPQVQGGVLLPPQFLEASYYEYHVIRRVLGSKATTFHSKYFVDGRWTVTWLFHGWSMARARDLVRAVGHVRP